MTAASPTIPIFEMLPRKWWRKWSDWLTVRAHLPGFVEETIGRAGTEMECTPPCWSIDDYTDTFFNVSGCGCDAAPTDPDRRAYWPGIFVQHRDTTEGIPPPTPIVIDHTRRCVWGTRLNGQAYETGNSINGVVLLSGRPFEAGPNELHTMLVPTSDGHAWNLRIRCDDGTTNWPVIWEGTNKSVAPEGSPFEKTDGCDTHDEINLSRLPSQSCYCEPVTFCPTTATECESCEATFYATISGFIQPEDDEEGTHCTTLNGCYTLTKGGTCQWAAGGPPDPGFIGCFEHDNNLGLPGGYWVFRGFQQIFAILGPEDCPPTSGTYDLRTPCGNCFGDEGQFPTLVLHTTACP